ncbi:carboxypeptidase-like regulatory domain-containing protein [Pedobacter fastidiosus]|uniref:carboxypeptidase-like regulatory domain-containing protein n=1 Tax=Pedobacter fastidiosus TaxID=2765361 RepID=UPI001C9B8DEA|nr:carboxypeptidase-like regulatory domain-containing protein [Pedobacter fastidiosus]
MKKFFMLLSLVLSAHTASAQYTFKAKIFNDQTKAVLKGTTATIPDLNISISADTSGILVIPNVPRGKFEIEISYVGFGKSEMIYNFPLQHPSDIITIRLEPSAAE